MRSTSYQVKYKSLSVCVCFAPYRMMGMILPPIWSHTCCVASCDRTKPPRFSREDEPREQGTLSVSIYHIIYHARVWGIISYTDSTW